MHTVPSGRYFELAFCQCVLMHILEEFSVQENPQDSKDHGADNPPASLPYAQTETNLYVVDFSYWQYSFHQA